MAEARQHDRPVDIHGQGYSRAALLIIILVATFAGTLMQTSLGTAIPTLMHDFGINLATAQQATTWFLLANGIMIPVSAYLTTKFPTKWLLLSAYGIMLSGMLVTALTPAQHSMWFMFLLGRVLTALAVGITMPLMQVILVNIFPAEERGAAMGLSGLVVGLAPAIGPTLSGWILDQDHYVWGLVISSSWRNIFYLPLIVLAIAFLLGFVFLRDVVPNRPVKLDVLSLTLSIFGFGLFLLGFTNVATDGWGDVRTVLTPISIGAIIILLFIWRQLRMKDPFMDVRVFLNKQFTVTTIAVMMAMMAMMGVEMMLPTYLQNVHGISAFYSGLMLLPGALVMGAMSPVAGAVYDKVGAKRMTLLGFSILALGTVPFLFLTSTTPDHYITALYTVRMFGIAMVMMPLTASAMSALPPEEAGHATASNNTARQIASAVVVALLTSVTQNIINHNEPAASLKTANPLRYADHLLNASMDGFQASFLIGLIFALVGIGVAFFLRDGKVIAQATKQVDGEEQV